MDIGLDNRRNTGHGMVLYKKNQLKIRGSLNATWGLNGDRINIFKKLNFETRKQWDIRSGV